MAGTGMIKALSVTVLQARSVRRRSSKEPVERTEDSINAGDATAVVVGNVVVENVVAVVEVVAVVDLVAVVVAVVPWFLLSFLSA